MTSSFSASSPSESGSQTKFAPVENARHSWAIQGILSVNGSFVLRIHVSSSKKMFSQNDHFINLACLS